MPKSIVADKFVVRFPDNLRDAVAELAARNGRSMNSEIVHRLNVAVNAGLDLSVEDTYNQLAALDVESRKLVKDLIRKLTAVK